jgi:hypothetical protein
MWDLIRSIPVAALICTALVVPACSGKSQTQTAANSVAQATTAAPAEATPTPSEAASVSPPAAETAAPVAATAAPPAGPSSDGDAPGSRVTIQSLKRNGDTVTLRFTLSNASSQELGTQQFNGDGYRGFRSFSGVNLIDNVGKKKYFPVADTDRNCICSNDVPNIEANSAANLWVEFPAPPASVQKITVEIPHFQPINDVPITQ